MKRCFLLAGLLISLAIPTDLFAQTGGLGSSIVSYLADKQTQRVGGGEPGDMVIEALRVSGAEFYSGDIGPDYPSSGDTVWGTLVTSIYRDDGSVVDSAPSADVLPGDVIQFCDDVKIADKEYPEHFTAIVRTVSSQDASRPTSIFVQDLDDNRTVQAASLSTGLLQHGSLRIYRPAARRDAPNVWKFTIVNNVSSSQTYTIMVGTDAVKVVNSAGANAAGSFFVHRIETNGTVPAIVNGDAYLYVQNATGDEFYGSPLAIRQLK